VVNEAVDNQGGSLWMYISCCGTQLYIHGITADEKDAERSDDWGFKSRE